MYEFRTGTKPFVEHRSVGCDSGFKSRPLNTHDSIKSVDSDASCHHLNPTHHERIHIGLLSPLISYLGTDILDRLMSKDHLESELALLAIVNAIWLEYRRKGSLQYLDTPPYYFVREGGVCFDRFLFPTLEGDSTARPERMASFVEIASCIKRIQLSLRFSNSDR